MTAKPCSVCAHLERALIDALLTEGLSPRAISKRFGATTRQRLTHHRDTCLVLRKAPNRKRDAA